MRKRAAARIDFMSTQTLHLKLTIAGVPVEAAVAVPSAPAPRHVLLPILQNLTDTVVAIAEREAQAAGFSVSCRKGCDACCRQMVPISPTEAHALAITVGGLTAAKQTRILKRFEAAEKELDRVGLLERLERRHTLTAEEQHQLDVDYFGAQIPCPFLERHACSIHAQRPLACREYLVTTPAPNCGNPIAGQVRRLELAAKVSTALVGKDVEGWVPLTLARRFVAVHAEPVAELRETLGAILNFL